jgi:hypothetical protein
MPFSNLLRNHCTGDSLSVHIIMKTSSNVENIFDFNGQYGHFPDDNL